MTADIGIFIINNCPQLKLADGDLAGDESLETAVIISLMSDKRINESELPPGTLDKKGWWGDSFPDVEGDQIGSTMWLSERIGKNTVETLAQLETAAVSSLNWMIEDGVAVSVTASAEFDTANSTVISIVIQRPGQDEADRFSLNWDAQELRRA